MNPTPSIPKEPTDWTLVAGAARGDLEARKVFCWRYLPVARAALGGARAGGDAGLRGFLRGVVRMVARRVAGAGTFILERDWLVFALSEAGQAAELNGDGDLDDDVLFVARLRP